MIIMTTLQTNQLQLNKQSIETELKPYRNEPLKAIAEYIRNAFDANAEKVEIIFKSSEWDALSAPTELTIKDNWDWWIFEKTETQYFLSSNKHSNEDTRSTLPHWKLWRWRYAFVRFADSMQAKSGKKIMKLDSDINISVEDVQENIQWTEVTLLQINNTLLTSLWLELQKFLCLEFWWFLAGNNKLSIEINGTPLVIDSIIKEKKSFYKNDFSEKLQTDLNQHNLQVDVIVWNEKPKEYSKFFMFTELWSSEIFTKTTGFNQQGDQFRHAVYIYSPIFEQNDINEDYNDGNALPLEVSANKKIKQKIFNEVRNKLALIRRPILEANSKKVVENLYIEDSVPNLNDYGIYDKDSFDNLLQEIYVIAPKLFSSNSPKERSFVCNTFAALLSSQDVNLIKKVIEQVFWLEQEDKDKLENLLERTNLASIVKTVSEIQMRLDVIANLESLLFEYKKETLEVRHLQQILNKNPWIFGEQFRLFVDTEWALKDTLYKYATDVLDIQDPEIESTSRKELDLFLVKTSSETEIIRKNIIIEIKRPSITLWKKEYDQIDLYANQILEESICNDPNTYREFYLIGNDYGDDIVRKIENSKNHWEAHKWLTESVLDGRRKIYVRKRSSILLTEHKYKLQYLQEKLKLASKKTANSPDEIVNDTYI
jgi:hypothetical protein